MFCVSRVIDKINKARVHARLWLEPALLILATGDTSNANHMISKNSIKDCSHKLIDIRHGGDTLALSPIIMGLTQFGWMT